MSILILLSGVGCAVFYFRKPPKISDPITHALLSNRPWRRLGAAICLVLAVMFVLGVYLVDVPDRPRAYAAYWAVMLVLVMWLGSLAIKDILHTRRIIATWRDARHSGASAAAESAADASKEHSPHSGQKP